MSPGNRIFWMVQGLLKYAPFGWCVALRGWLYRPFFASVGKHLRVHDNVLIKYPDEITLGDHVTVNPGCILAGKGGLAIGSEAMIGAGTKIVTTSHVSASTEIPMRQQGMVTSPVVIADDVWFGFDVKVLPGATIGRGAIIGAGAVVTGEIPAWSVAAGVPARVVSRRQP